jgi:hypothetical protein
MPADRRAGRWAVLKLPPRILRDLDFGAPAAERDIGHGLEKYFVESAARLSNGRRRSSWGTGDPGRAPSSVLASRERGSYVIELAPEDYPELLSPRWRLRTLLVAKHGACAAA